MGENVVDEIDLISHWTKVKSSRDDSSIRRLLCQSDTELRRKLKCKRRSPCVTDSIYLSLEEKKGKNI